MLGSIFNKLVISILCISAPLFCATASEIDDDWVSHSQGNHTWSKKNLQTDHQTNHSTNLKTLDKHIQEYKLYRGAIIAGITVGAIAAIPLAIEAVNSTPFFLEIACCTAFSFCVGYIFLDHEEDFHDYEEDLPSKKFDKKRNMWYQGKSLDEITEEDVADEITADEITEEQATKDIANKQTEGNRSGMKYDAEADMYYQGKSSRWMAAQRQAAVRAATLSQTANI